MVKDMDKEIKYGKMVQFMKANGKMIESMEKEE